MTAASRTSEGLSDTLCCLTAVSLKAEDVSAASETLAVSKDAIKAAVNFAENFSSFFIALEIMASTAKLVTGGITNLGVICVSGRRR